MTKFIIILGIAAILNPVTTLAVSLTPANRFSSPNSPSIFSTSRSDRFDLDERDREFSYPRLGDSRIEKNSPEKNQSYEIADRYGLDDSDGRGSSRNRRTTNSTPQ